MAALKPFLLLASLPLILAQGGCFWSQLRNSADVYAESQAAGAVGEAYLSPALNYTENGYPATIATGLLSRPLEAAYSHTIIDQVGCAVFVELIASSAYNIWYIVNTQLRFVNDPELGDLRAEVVDTVFNASSEDGARARIGYLEGEDWGSISTPDQVPRDELRALAEGYLNGEGEVAWAAGCARLEGATYVSSAEGSCDGDEGEEREEYVDRKFVIDPSRSAVSVMSTGPSGASSHEFRIEEGKLRYVHSM